MRNRLKVLVACEFSGVVRDALTARGHLATSCDILPTERPGQHFEGDVLRILRDGWDLMIAHPPCTYLCNSGVRWLSTEPGRVENMCEATRFFRALLNAPIKYVAVENPIMHKYAVERIGRRQDQVVQPWMFGHPEKKATCLWLKNLPKLVPTNDVREEMAALPKSKSDRIHQMSPGPERSRLRSITYQGIADAMAEQWGSYVQADR